MSSAQSKTHFIFDVEGTLVDCSAQQMEAWRETFEQHGFDIPMPAIHAELGRDTDEMLAAVLPDVAPERRHRIARDNAEIYRARFLDTIEPLPGVRELFEKLRAAGARIALATSCQPDELKRYLDILAVQDLIDGVACGDEVKHAKPYPDLLEHALRKLRALPAQAVAVGDTPFDAPPARQLGVASIGVLTGGFTASRLFAAGFDRVHRDPVDLADHVEELLAAQLLAAHQPQIA